MVDQKDAGGSLTLEQPVADYGTPQLEDGHTRIANELLEAIISFDFSKRQYKVVLFVLRKTYGWNKKADVMSLSQILAGTGLTRGHACDTVNELVYQKVLLKQEHRCGQLIEINKKYKQWMVLPKREPVPETGTKVLPKREQSVTKTGTTKDNTKRQLNTDIAQLAFSECWKEYPRKVGKGAAEKAWKKLPVDHSLYASIFRAIKAQKANPSARLGNPDKQYIPHFSTWLNDTGWEDEYAPADDTFEGVL
jgi:phage replication O-like protein O